MRNNNQDGSILITVLILLTISAAIVGSMISISMSKLDSLSAAKQRSSEYHQAEKAINQTVQWLRDNSQKMVTPYRREEFYSTFNRIPAAFGANDTAPVAKVDTIIALSGTSNAALLTNDPDLGTNVFPPTVDITTNAAFDTAGSFTTMDFGDVSVRLTLVNGAPDVPGADTGSGVPETDFFPIYRIDAMSEADGGVHLYATVKGQLAHVFDLGIYGQDYLEIKQPCDSYVSETDEYSSTTKRANCPAGSNSTSAIHKNEEVYGSMQTNGTIVAESPFGGETCADFETGCPNKGSTCAGEDCGVPLLEIYQDWAFYCPSGVGRAPIDVTGTTASPQEITVTSNDQAERCIQEVKAGSNTAFRLTSTQFPYYIENLDLANNAQMIIDPNPSGGTVVVYVQNIVGGAFNGNQTVNAAGHPTNFQLIYLGTDPLNLNGTAEMKVALVAPKSQLTVSGSFEFYGAILAKELLLQGSGGVHYDESLGGSGPVSDIRYRVLELAQYYR